MLYRGTLHSEIGLILRTMGYGYVRCAKKIFFNKRDFNALDIAHEVFKKKNFLIHT